MSENASEMLARMGTDAALWAKEWCRIAKEIETADDGRVVIDEGWMIGWFTNAIMAGVDSVKRCEDAERLVVKGLVAFDLTRQYVGEDMLPEIEGWSWYDWCQNAEEYLREAT